MPKRDPSQEALAALRAMEQDEPSAAWGRADGPEEILLLLPMALTRDEEAVKFLLHVVESESTPLAATSVEALSIFRSDTNLLNRVSETVNRRGGLAVTRAFTMAFET